MAFVSAQSLECLHVSSLTFAEIRFGIELIADPHKRAALHDWLNLRLRPMFANRVLPVSEDIMLKWRLLVEDGSKTGHTVTQPDLIIAATALHHGLTIVSHDVGGYARTGASLINTWRG